MPIDYRERKRKRKKERKKKQNTCYKSISTNAISHLLHQSEPAHCHIQYLRGMHRWNAWEFQLTTHKRLMPNFRDMAQKSQIFYWSRAIDNSFETNQLLLYGISIDCCAGTDENITEFQFFQSFALIWFFFFLFCLQSKWHFAF